MPVPVAAKVGIVAASVAVAAAIAIYEIPEVRRAAEDLRRRIAIALHSLGDNVDPNNPNARQPRFNRPEDSEGFYQSHDVDTDEETRRRQREELMYWNMRREAEKQRQSSGNSPRSRGSTFDDFLQPDGAGDSGTYVYNSGANAWDTDSSNVLRRRGNADGVRGLSAGILANPFSDEYGIELDEHVQSVLSAPEAAMSDIYDATPLAQSPLPVAPAQPVPVAPAREVLFDFASLVPSTYNTAPSETHHHQQQQPTSPTTTTTRSATLDRELAEDEYMTAGQDDRHAADAYASIQAWAQHSSSSSQNHNNSINNTSFYSPLPSTPRAPVSEPELISEGQLTPADSASVAGSGVDVAREVGGEEHREYDVMSETDGGVPTPGSWSEVGSVVSESESLARA